jgi:hypothetical protein
VSDNRVLRKIFRPKRTIITGENGIMKSLMIWTPHQIQNDQRVEHVSLMGEQRNAQGFGGDETD